MSVLHDPRSRYYSPVDILAQKGSPKRNIRHIRTHFHEGAAGYSYLSSRGKAAHPKTLQDLERLAQYPLQPLDHLVTLSDPFISNPFK
jgi:hypothetical protein